MTDARTQCEMATCCKEGGGRRYGQEKHDGVRASWDASGGARQARVGPRGRGRMPRGSGITICVPTLTATCAPAPELTSVVSYCPATSSSLQLKSNQAAHPFWAWRARKDGDCNGGGVTARLWALQSRCF